jgi:RecA/RadA recombinase
MAKVKETKTVNDIVSDITADLLDAKTGLTVNEDEVPGVKTRLDVYNDISGGGIPIRKHILLTGAPGGGKSTLAVEYAASFHMNDPKSLVYYIDIEQGLTKERLAKLGVDTNRLLLISGVITMEQIIPLFKRLCEKKEEHKRMDTTDLIIWDSESFTVLGAQVKAEDGKGNVQPGVKAKMLSFIYPRMAQLALEYNLTFVTISQLRDKLNMNPYAVDMTSLKGLGDKTITGGQIAKYAPFQIINVRPKAFVEADKWGFTGVFSEVTFVKNRLSPPHVKFEICLDYLNGYSNFWTKFKNLKTYKKIKSSGGKGPNSCLINYTEFKFYITEIENVYNTNKEFKVKFDALYEECKEEILTYSNVEGSGIDNDGDDDSEISLESTKNILDKSIKNLITDSDIDISLSTESEDE